MCSIAERLRTGRSGQPAVRRRCPRSPENDPVRHHLGLFRRRRGALPGAAREGLAVADRVIFVGPNSGSAAKLRTGAFRDRLFTFPTGISGPRVSPGNARCGGAHLRESLDCRPSRAADARRARCRGVLERALQIEIRLPDLPEIPHSGGGARCSGGLRHAGEGARCAVGQGLATRLRLSCQLGCCRPPHQGPAASSNASKRAHRMCSSEGRCRRPDLWRCTGQHKRRSRTCRMQHAAHLIGSPC